MYAQSKENSLSGWPLPQIAACPIHVRRFPFPYEAALVICSDLDETPTRDMYYETAKFLNTRQMTSMGSGVGLEVGNTIYFDMPQGQFSYWNTDDTGRSLIAQLIRSGHIDCLHSYGENATLRGHAEKAINALSQQGCKLDVWIDHATAPSNFGPDIMRGKGDVPTSEVYHADLSCEFGIRFVWIGRVTSVIGQDSIRSVKGIWSNAYKMASFRTVAKEIVKGLLALVGSAKYAMHRSNSLIRKIKLRDGREVFEFMRCNAHWKGVSSGDTADGIAQVLVPKVLDRLVERQSVCILYTHLGKTSNRALPFRPATIRAFNRLSEYSLKGKILVTTASRLLKYSLAVGELFGSCGMPQDGRYAIRLNTSYPRDLDGLTLYTPEPHKTVVTINDREIEGLTCNPADPTGRRSVSLPWPKLEFPLL
jgi:hypothetical protein